MINDPGFDPYTTYLKPFLVFDQNPERPTCALVQHPGRAAVLLAAFATLTPAQAFAEVEERDSVIMESGDTVWQIATEHNLDPAQVLAWNTIAPGEEYNLPVGRKIYLEPAAEALTKVVLTGNKTIYQSIMDAGVPEVNVPAVLTANGVDTIHTLTVGDVLFVSPEHINTPATDPATVLPIPAEPTPEPAPAPEPDALPDVWQVDPSVPFVETLPPPTNTTLTFDQVNALPYRRGEMGPAVQAFQAVTTSRGWSQATIDAWTPFLIDVVSKESDGCWNIKRGQTVDENCNVTSGKGYEDYGFGQIIRLHDDLLAEKLGFTSHDDIIASPWNSMASLVVLLERYGDKPWCYIEADGTQTVHDCYLAPQGLPVVLSR